MKNIMNKALAFTADAALKAAVASAGCASRAGTYQSKEPVELVKYMEENNKY